jgi:TonB family protein
MSQFHDTELRQTVTGAQLTTKDPVFRGERKASAGRIRRSARDKYIARTTVLTVAALGILLVPFISLLSRRAHLQELPFFSSGASDPGKTSSAVLAVDTFGFNIRAQHASAGRRELFEQIAVQHLARLHRTYNSWAERNQELMGSLLIKFAVDATGTVGRVELLDSQVTNAIFIQSVMADVRTWKFPKGGVEAIEITVPLLFVPKGMDPETVVQWERKFRSAQEVETSLARLPVAEKPLVTPVSHNNRASLPVVPDSDRKSAVQVEGKFRSAQEVETSLARLPVADKPLVTPVSHNNRTSLPVGSHSDHKTVVQADGKARSAQEAQTSLARPPVTEKQLGTPASHNNRTSLPVVSDSDRKARKSSSVDSPKPKTEELAVAFKINRPVAIRENPRFSSKKVHEADEETHLRVLEDRGDWLKVSLAGPGLIGFVRKEFVSPTN